ncbi:hypothetical protein EYF80_019951 [Liparis tanakae]|uniref:Uncharacterized protein n=1 Tax=Liparis tanakae TaxID=230148 RepID=A0A4Z2HY26_9TELE|nr:hypothetical protein EYF80_019951 [Liparis tanakae]
MQTTSSKDLPPLCPSLCLHLFHISCWMTSTLQVYFSSGQCWLSLPHFSTATNSNRPVAVPSKYKQRPLSSVLPDRRDDAHTGQRAESDSMMGYNLLLPNNDS